MTILATIATIFFVAACIQNVASYVLNITEALSSGMTTNYRRRHESRNTSRTSWQKAYSVR